MRNSKGLHVLISIRKVACRATCALEAWHLHELVVCVKYLRQVHSCVACTASRFKEQALCFIL